MRIDKLMPGVSVEQVRETTAFEPLLASNIVTIPEPTEEELRLLRDEVDPEREYLGGEE